MSKLAILGGDPVRTKPWPAWPDGRDRDAAAVQQVVASGQWWYHAGSQVAQFEQEFAEHHGAAHAIAVSGGTTALATALLALGVEPGEEVIVPAYTFQATATAVLLVGGIPVFADVEAGTLNLDPDAVIRALTPKTRAIIPVHFAGLPADLDRLREVAAAQDAFVLEDACQAHGAIYRGRKVGAIGAAGGFSFQASKNLCAGEGGAVLTDDPAVAMRAQAIRDCGRVPGETSGDSHILGYNFRMTEMQGALLRSRLPLLEAETELRWRHGRWLTEKLASLPCLEPLDPSPQPGDRRAYHLYAMRYRSESLGGLPRERFIQALEAEGIPCRPGYEAPLYRNPAFPAGSFRATDCPAAEKLCREVVWLFHNVLLGGEEDVADIARACEKVAGSHQDLL